MKPRDLAIVAAVVLLGGFAVADALRSNGDESSTPPTQSVSDGREGPEPQADAPEEWPTGRVRGALVFTDAEAFRVRVDLASAGGASGLPGISSPSAASRLRRSASGSPSAQATPTPAVS